jgi:hypothetical protein
MKNIFLDFPDFIDSDTRIFRNDSEKGTYQVTNNLQYQRHNLSMPNLTGLSVLDLGCCVGATGAWALCAGAKRYVGVELHNIFSSIAEKNLQTHFANDCWQIINQSFEDFFKNNHEKFDVVIAWGVLYQSMYYESLIRNITKICKSTLIVDSIAPYHTVEYPCVEYVTNYRPVVPPGMEPKFITAAMPNLLALTLLLGQDNFKLINDLTAELRAESPLGYQQRFFVVFEKISNLNGHGRRYE